MFSGQMDVVVSTLMTEHFLSDLSWSGRDDYLQADKITWKDNHGEVAGYVTKVNTFTRVSNSFYFRGLSSLPELFNCITVVFF